MGVNTQDRMLLAIDVGNTNIVLGVLAARVAPETDIGEQIDPELPLRGLRIVWDRNQ